MIILNLSDTSVSKQNHAWNNWPIFLVVGQVEISEKMLTLKANEDACSAKSDSVFHNV